MFKFDKYSITDLNLSKGNIDKLKYEVVQKKRTFWAVVFGKDVSVTHPSTLK